MDYDTEFAGFIQGNWAMVYNGLWALARIEQEMGGAAKVGVFLMPSFPGRPSPTTIFPIRRRCWPVEGSPRMLRP